LAGMYLISLLSGQTYRPSNNADPKITRLSILRELATALKLFVTTSSLTCHSFGPDLENSIPPPKFKGFGLSATGGMHYV